MDDLTSWLEERLDADDALADDAKYLVLAALEGDDALDALIPGAPPRTHEGAETEPPPPPVGAYLKSITVQGFRGIGDRATLELQPKPGLTIVSGRNGSGKSSFAEALEVALTFTSYRWNERSAQWGSAWRNLHANVPPEIQVVLAQEGVGKTVVGVTWDGDDLKEIRPTLQRQGEKREEGIESLGWTAPMEAYRPLLSYEELGKVLGDGPSKLYDSLARILGLEQVTDAIKRLDERQKRLAAPGKALAEAKRTLRTTLAGLDDERAAAAEKLLAARALDSAALRALAAGTTTEDGTIAHLRALANLTTPEPTDAERAAAELVAAVEAMSVAGDAVTSALERRIDITERALELHQHDGDQQCPLCGTGTLDSTWAEAARASVESDRGRVAALKSTRARLAAARAAVHGLTTAVPSTLTTPPPDALSDAVAVAHEAWSAWAAVPDGDLAAAEHVRTALTPLATALATLRAEAQSAIAQRDDSWTSVASRLAAYADEAEAWEASEPEAATAKSAHAWLKRHDVELKNERLVPIAERAAEIWRELRQESNVDINGLTLAGTATRRRVAINAAVDGEETGALAVMSQGELHALALALFLPRATMPESPFRFVVLDDPVQAMDPAKVDGLVATLARIAEDRQVVVFSHDDRLAAAVRRAPVDAQIWEVTRYDKSKVEISNTFDPAGRLRDAFALIKDDGLPDATLRKALPGLLRLAAEAAARDRYWTVRLAAGDTHANVEKTWTEARLTRDRVSLAVYDEVRSLNRWLGAGDHRRRALGICSSGMHNGLRGDPLLACQDVERMVADVKAGGK